MVHLTQTEARLRLQTKQTAKQRNHRAREMERRRREITYYYPDVMVIFGYADGYYIEPESNNYFRFSTLSVVVAFVVCLQSCFCCVLEAQKYFSFIFKKMPMHKTTQKKKRNIQNENVFLFVINLRCLFSVLSWR